MPETPDADEGDTAQVQRTVSADSQTPLLLPADDQVQRAELGTPAGSEPTDDKLDDLSGCAADTTISLIGTAHDAGSDVDSGGDGKAERSPNDTAIFLDVSSTRLVSCFHPRRSPDCPLGVRREAKQLTSTA